MVNFRRCIRTIFFWVKAMYSDEQRVKRWRCSTVVANVYGPSMDTVASVRNAPRRFYIPFMFRN